jgi:hypothetical protein
MDPAAEGRAVTVTDSGEETVPFPQAAFVPLTVKLPEAAEPE